MLWREENTAKFWLGRNCMYVNAVKTQLNHVYKNSENGSVAPVDFSPQRRLLGCGLKFSMSETSGSRNPILTANDVM